MEQILVVDDEKNYLLVMATLLTEQGYEVRTAESGQDALDMIDAGLDLILTDMTMPKMDGIELLARIKESRPDLPVIMMTAHGTVEKAVEAMKIGAFDYITKPFRNEDLMRTIRKALEVGRLRRENLQLSQALKERHSLGGIVGKSKPMLGVFNLIEKVADTRANVLITGESGTGKELIAKAVHYNSPRAKGPFVAVNCSALADTLLESELFGHERGAFTDARITRKGRFELSAGGTIFLDEIGEMSTNLQAKLLRVLQERKFERVGGMATIEVDVRIIAATNRDLKKEVANGRFREDLFYRLNVVHIHVPPLRERPDDIPLLVTHFLEKYGDQVSGRPPVRDISPEALRRFFAYPWPGNVRELENAIERAVILCSGKEIHPSDLPEEIAGAHTLEPEVPNGSAGDEESIPEESGPADTGPDIELEGVAPKGLPLQDTLEAVEKAMIRWALDQADQVQSRAADLLGVKNTALHYKLKKYPPGQLNDDPGLRFDPEPFMAPEWGLPRTLEAIEKKMIREALDRSGQVQTAAAKKLGISKKLLHYKLKKYSLT